LHFYYINYVVQTAEGYKLKNNFIDTRSMIKATYTLTTALFIFTGCGGGDQNGLDSDVSSTSIQTTESSSTPTPTSTSIQTTETNSESSSTPTPTLSLKWYNNDIPTQNNITTVTFNVQPLGENLNSVIGFSDGVVSEYADMGIIVRFAPSGFIDARDGESYSANADIPYESNKEYSFKLKIDFSAHTYTIYITPQDGQEILLGEGFKFRLEHSSLISINNMAYYSTESNTINVGEVTFSNEKASIPAPVPQSKSNAHPNWLINQNEIDAIKEKIAAQEEPWASAYNDLIKRANGWLDQSPLSVRTAGTTHDWTYYGEAPYAGWLRTGNSPCGKDYCDGYHNPDADRGDYKAAIKMGDAVRDLGMAYAFSGDSVYADKAVQLINTWFVNDSTKMRPNYPSWQSYIELFITMPGAFYGADLIWNYDGWSSTDKEVFLSWVSEFADRTKKLAGMTDPTGVNANNFVDWRMVSLSAMAVLLEDQSLVDYVYDYAKKTLVHQVREDGALPHEYGRADGLSYSSYAVNALLQTAEALRHQDIDLYHYEGVDGKGNFKKMIDWIAPYIAAPSTWPYNQHKTYNGTTDNAAAFEFADNIWSDAIIDKVINRWGTPMYETRTAGSVTLLSKD